MERGWRILRHNTEISVDGLDSLHRKKHLDNIVKILEHQGMKFQPLRKMTVEGAAEATEMYRAGIAIGPIASYFQVSRQGMWDLLRRRTKMRPQRKTGAGNHFHRGGKNWDGRAHDLMEYALQKGIIIRKYNGSMYFTQDRLQPIKLAEIRGFNFANSQ